MFFPVAVFMNQFCKKVGRQGFAEEVSLHFLASLLKQKGQLLFCLDPLGDDIESQTMGHGNDGGNNRPVIRVGGGISDKGPVNLQGINGKPLQLTQ